MIYSAIAGSLMILLPHLMRTISPKFNSEAIAPGMLTPYNALVCFGVGVLVTNAAWNTLFMRREGDVYGFLPGGARGCM